MEGLTARQRAYLRRLAHPLKPLLHLGKEGVTRESIEALRQALSRRELIKVRVLEAAPLSATESGHELTAGIEGSAVVAVGGRVVVIYRPHPERPEIRLPRTAAH